MECLTVKTYKYKDLPDNARKNAIHEYKEKLHKNGVVDGIILNRLKHSLKRKGLPTRDVNFSIDSQNEDFVHFYGPLELNQFIETFEPSMDNYPELNKLKDINQNVMFQIEPVSCVFCENQNNLMVKYYLLNSGMDTDKYYKELDPFSELIQQKSLETACSLVGKAYNIASEQLNENIIEDELINKDYEFLENGTFVNPALFSRVSFNK